MRGVKMKIKIPTKTDSGYVGMAEIEGTDEEVKEVLEKIKVQEKN